MSAAQHGTADGDHGGAGRVRSGGQAQGGHDDVAAHAAECLRDLVLAAQELRNAWATQIAVGLTDTYALSYLAAGELTPSQLARSLSITTGSVTGLVDRLEAAGLARREARPGDRRATNVVLTDHGRHELAAAVSRTESALTVLPPAALRSFSDQLETVAESMRDQAHRLEQETDEQAGTPTAHGSDTGRAR